MTTSGILEHAVPLNVEERTEVTRFRSGLVLWEEDLEWDRSFLKSILRMEKSRLG